MKPNHCSSPRYLHILLIALTVLFLTACKKEDLPASKLTAASEIVKIYAPIGKSVTPRILRTTLFPLGGFEWVDDLGAILPGAKNAKFFKEPTGHSEFNH